MFEVFNTVTGATLGYFSSAGAAGQMAESCGGGYDYERAPAGFYVVGMAGRAVGKAYASREAAQSAADMRNMGSDCDSFSVREA